MKPVPHSVEAEQGVLGSLLLSPRTVAPECVQRIGVDHFTVPAHKTIYSVALELAQAGSAIDLITFTQTLRDRHLLDAIGGPGFITDLFTFVPDASNLDYYLDILRDKFALRSIILAATEGVRCSYEEQADIPKILSDLQDGLIAATLPLAVKEELLSDLIEAKLRRMEHGEPDSDIIPTGLAQLDAQSPIRKGDMPLISGVRKSGKSIFALTLAINIARQGTGVLYFSLEDRIPKVVDRIMANVSRLPMHKHHVTKLSRDEMMIPIKAASEISKLPLFIRDDLFDLSSIAAVSKQFKQKHNIGLFIVDYAQLIRAPDSKEGNREQKVAEVSRTLRLLAMALDTPIIVLCQLNQEGYTRESRALENDATAMFRIDEIEDEPNVRRIIIPWQRNGVSGIGFKVTFLGEIARVENYADENM